MHHIIKVPFAMISAPMEELIDFLSLLPKDLFSSGSENPYWAEDVHLLDIYSLKTKVTLLVLKGADLTNLLRISKQNKTTLHSMFHTVTLFAIHKYLLNAEEKRS